MQGLYQFLSEVDVRGTEKLSTMTYAHLVILYELMNKSGTVFKALDKVSGKHSIMKRFRPLCGHEQCLQEESVWEEISEERTMRAK